GIMIPPRVLWSSARRRTTTRSPSGRNFMRGPIKFGVDVAMWSSVAAIHAHARGANALHQLDGTRRRSIQAPPILLAHLCVRSSGPALAGDVRPFKAWLRDPGEARPW